MGRATALHPTSPSTPPATDTAASSLQDVDTTALVLDLGPRPVEPSAVPRQPPRSDQRSNARPTDRPSRGAGASAGPKKGPAGKGNPRNRPTPAFTPSGDWSDDGGPAAMRASSTAAAAAASRGPPRGQADSAVAGRRPPPSTFRGREDASFDDEDSSFDDDGGDDIGGGRSNTGPKNSARLEHKVSGENACRALFHTRPDDIRRVYITEALLPRFKDVLRFCAEQRIAYHVKESADLDQVAETVHHDGVLFLARKQSERQVDDVLSHCRRLRPDQACVIVLLEGVKNPHNLGAILRVCAHFGVPFALRAGATPALSPAAMRTAEGGAEHTAVVDVGDGVDVLRALKALNFTVLATSSHATVGLGHDPLPRRAVVLFGAEGGGLSQALMTAADEVVAIPGSGALESLNVACAASVLLWELWRNASSGSRPQPRHHDDGPPPRRDDGLGPRRAPDRSPRRPPPRR